MAAPSPSAALRQQLREKISERIEQLQLGNADAAEQLGFSAAQVSRLKSDQDIFTLDRLIDAAARIELAVRMTVTRPYRRP